MRNLKELQPVLAAIYCINRLNEHEDEDIRNLIDYAYDRILGNSTRMLMLACIGRTKADAMPEIMQVLKEDTNYIKYLEEHKK